MKRVEVVYFSGCPLLEKARAALKNAGATSFVEINQDKLSETHAYRDLSSPSILLNGELIAGSRGSRSRCSIVEWGAVADLLRRRLSAENSAQGSAR